MANVVLFLIAAAMTVLLVMSLFAVITMSPADAVGTGLPVPAPDPVGQPGDSGEPAWRGVPQIVTANGPYPPNAPGGPPWERAARPPDPW